MYSYPYICCVIYDPPRIPVVHLVSPEPRSELEKLYAQDYAMLHTTSDWALARLSTRAREGDAARYRRRADASLTDPSILPSPRWCAHGET